MIQPSSTASDTVYTGRFAPSPSGPLHLGSLIAALASYLHARTHNGYWLVRMEDLDPPREQPGAADAILASLEAHQLTWDGPVLYQSQRHSAYEAILADLRAAGLVYPCSCTRQDLKAMGGIYDGRCRHRPSPAPPFALRLKLCDLPLPRDSWPDTLTFTDLIQGPQEQSLREEGGDIIVKRKDGFYAYQLAVVADDIEQKITHVVRGADLLPVTARQLRLFELLDRCPPAYGHAPLALHANGQKLSKQNKAPALDNRTPGSNLWRALHFLGQNPPADLKPATAVDLIEWALAHWEPTRIQGLGKVPHDSGPAVSGPAEREMP